MEGGIVVQVSTFPGWIVGVSRSEFYEGFLCWVVDPDCNVLNDGRSYETSNAAMLAGRAYVEHFLDKV